MRDMIAHGLGFVGLGMAAFIFLGKSRRQILTLKLISNVVWATHFFLIGAYSGMLLNIINLFRESIFYQKDKKAWAAHPFWICLFVGVSLLSSALTWQGMVSLLPAVGSAIAAIGYWCKKPMHIRMLNFPGVFLWFIYSIIMRTPSNVISNFVSLCSIGVGLFRDVKGMKAEKAAV